MRSEQDVNRAIELYADTVKRICFLHLKNYHDTQDIFQKVFLKYLTYDGQFESESHRKAWFIRVTVNACKDWLRDYYRKNALSIEEAVNEYVSSDNGSREVISAVLSLEPKYKNVVYLFYFEGYSVGEISKMLQKKENTVYSLLSRAREKLKKELGGEDFE